MKMLEDATHILQHANDILNNIIVTQFIHPDEAEIRKTELFEHFLQIAKEYNFHFNLTLRKGKYENIEWFYEDIRIFPINGVIKPFTDIKLLKEILLMLLYDMKY